MLLTKPTNNPKRNDRTSKLLRCKQSPLNQKSVINQLYTEIHRRSIYLYIDSRWIEPTFLLSRIWAEYISNCNISKCSWNTYFSSNKQKKVKRNCRICKWVLWLISIFVCSFNFVLHYYFSIRLIIYLALPFVFNQRKFLK